MKNKATTAEVEKYFVRDAEKTISVLKDIFAKLQEERNSSMNSISPSLDDIDFKLYIITVHGIKTALANIGEIQLSGVAHSSWKKQGKSGISP